MIARTSPRHASEAYRHHAHAVLSVGSDTTRYLSTALAHSRAYAREDRMNAAFGVLANAVSDLLMRRARPLPPVVAIERDPAVDLATRP